LLGRSHEIGTVEAGKLADLLIVDGDPVADITVLEKRERFIAVIQGGIIRAGQLAAPSLATLPHETAETVAQS
jgi:imidazolonepropionase-like amidohydrolase